MTYVDLNSYSSGGLIVMTRVIVEDDIRHHGMRITLDTLEVLLRKCSSSA